MNKSLMFMIGIVFAFILAILPAMVVCAATSEDTVITGHVYDNNLNLFNKVVVLINTSPEQRIVVVNGTYYFSVPQGNYNIRVFYFHNQVYSENISANSPGRFINDIIVFDNLSVSGEMPKVSDIFNTTNVSSAQRNLAALSGDVRRYQIFTIIVVATLLAIVVFVLFRFEKRKNSLDNFIDIQNKIIRNKDEIPKIRKERHKQKKKNFEDRIIDFLKEETVVTQKDIKKKFFLSDTKVSLIISDLESRGIIKKIKKGRGNIIKFVPEVKKR